MPKDECGRRDAVSTRQYPQERLYRAGIAALVADDDLLVIVETAHARDFADIELYRVESDPQARNLRKSLHAPLQEQEAIGVEPAYVAGCKNACELVPTRKITARGRIAQHDIRPFIKHIPDVAGRKGVALIVEDTDLPARQRLADGAQLFGSVPPGVVVMRGEASVWPYIT